MYVETFPLQGHVASSNFPPLLPTFATLQSLYKYYNSSVNHRGEECKPADQYQQQPELTKSSGDCDVTPRHWLGLLTAGTDSFTKYVKERLLLEKTYCETNQSETFNQRWLNLYDHI